MNPSSNKGAKIFDINCFKEKKTVSNENKKQKIIHFD